MRRQITYSEKIFQITYMTKTFFLECINKTKSSKHNIIQTNQLKNGQKTHTIISLKRIYIYINAKRCLTYQPFREIQLKSTTRYHYILISIGKIKIAITSNVSNDTGELDHIYIVGDHVKWYIQYFGIYCISSCQTKNE